ncbi:MAG: hypothetical protein ACI4AH_02385 [Muribaculaceae bacterium]
MRGLIAIIVSAMAVFGVTARVNTTRKGVSGQRVASENLIVPVDTTMCDSTGEATHGFVVGGITIKGYNKQLSDRYETFFVSNNTGSDVGHVTITFLYTDINGKMLHKRTETVECNLANGETGIAKIRSFDRSTFYYYAGPKPRKSATPYKLKVHIESYEVVVKGK